MSPDTTFTVINYVKNTEGEFDDEIAAIDHAMDLALEFEEFPFTVMAGDQEIVTLCKRS